VPAKSAIGDRRRRHVTQCGSARPEAIVVDEVLEGEFAIRHGGNLGAETLLAVVEELTHDRRQGVRAVAGGESEQPLLADMAGRKQRFEIAEDDLGDADIPKQDSDQRLVAAAGIEQLEERYLQPLLEDLRSDRPHCRRRCARRCREVRDTGRIADDPAPDEDRLDDEDVGQVHPAFVGIVEDEDVAGIDVAGKLRTSVSSASGMAPRWSGMPQPCATTWPSASQMAVEKSMLSRTTCECAVRTMVMASSSAKRLEAALDDLEGDRVDGRWCTGPALVISPPP
jgi:hypothetical protein